MNHPVSLSDVLAQIDTYPTPKGVDAARFASLKAELKRLLVARATSGGRGSDRAATQAGALRTEGKTLSIAPTGTMNAVTDLAATVNPAGTQATLTWTEVLVGDFDNNGAVDITDLIPVALYYGQRTDSGPDDAHRLVNGDFNPEINIWDLGAIAGNYAAHLEGYQVWRGHFNGTSTDWETTFRPNTNQANPDWSADRPSPPSVSTRPAYTYTDDISGLADKANVRYKVTAYGDGAAGAESNEATVPPTRFIVTGRVTYSGVALAGATLSLWPGGLTADSQPDGTYAVTNVSNGSYKLTPTMAGYAFHPATANLEVSGANVTGEDFAGVHAAGLADSAWPKFRGNPANTGLSPYIGPQTDSVKWKSPTGGIVKSSPAIGVDGTIYVGCDGLYAITPADGSLKWKTVTGYVEYSSPAVSQDGTVYVGSNDGNLYAIDPADGSEIWSCRVYPSYDTYFLTSPTIGADGTIYVGSKDDNVYAINAGDGSVKWKCLTGNVVRSSAAVGTDGTIYIGSYDANLYALDPQDGSVKWKCGIPNGHPVESSPAIGADGTVYVGTAFGYLCAVNPANGSVEWVGVVGGSVGSPAIGPDGTIYLGSTWSDIVGSGGVAYALRPTDGSISWAHDLGLDGVYSSPAVGADGLVYIGSNDGNVYCLNPADGSIKWTYPLGDLFHYVRSSPAIGSDGTLYVGAYDNYLYAFGP